MKACALSLDLPSLDAEHGTDLRLLHRGVVDVVLAHAPAVVVGQGLPRLGRDRRHGRPRGLEWWDRGRRRRDRDRRRGVEATRVGQHAWPRGVRRDHQHRQRWVVRRRLRVLML